MNTLFLILLPLVISGLGFLSYRHPPIARKILNPLLYISAASFLILQVFYIIQSSAYYKASDATRIDIERKQENLNIDSLYNTTKDRDSIDNIIQNYKYQIQTNSDIYSSQTAVRDSINKNIDALLKDSRSTNNTYLLYCFAGFLIILILYGTSFLFDNIYNKENVSDINNTNEQTK